MDKMSKKTFEFATWPCSDKYANDPKTIQPAFRGLLGPERVKGLNTYERAKHCPACAANTCAYDSIFTGVDKEKQNGRAVLCTFHFCCHHVFVDDTYSPQQAGTHSRTT